jgi:UDPglucose--hexose-1-phosphate uridylyltransferase
MTPEFRTCPVTGRTVVIAPGRALRPITLTHAEPHHRRDRDGRAVCPFCEGQEHDTPGEVYAVRSPGSEPNGPGWSLRVVPNKFPATEWRAPGVNPGVADSTPGLTPGARPGIGVHECVIESATHVTNPTQMSDEHFVAVLIAWRERIRHFATDDRLAHVTPFKNVGAEAGASLAHVHSQLIALPFVPDAVREELAGAEAYYRAKGRCVFCDSAPLSPRGRGEQRIVFADEHFTVLCPFAPRFGHETWVLPTDHASHFETITDADALALARTLKRTLSAIDAVLSEPAYNLYVHTAPLRSTPLPHYHWHVEIIPRTARAAGFEWGSGVFINAVPPEQAAAQLRSVWTG